MFINLDNIENLTSEELIKLYEKNFSSSLLKLFKIGDMIVHYNRASGMKVWDKTYGKLKNATLPSTTFGGNTFAYVAAIETLQLIP